MFFKSSDPRNATIVNLDLVKKVEPLYKDEKDSDYYVKFVYKDLDYVVWIYRDKEVLDSDINYLINIS